MERAEALCRPILLTFKDLQKFPNRRHPLRKIGELRIKPPSQAGAGLFRVIKRSDRSPAGVDPIQCHQRSSSRTETSSLSSVMRYFNLVMDMLINIRTQSLAFFSLESAM